MVAYFLCVGIEHCNFRPPYLNYFKKFKSNFETIQMTEKYVVIHITALKMKNILEIKR